MIVKESDSRGNEPYLEARLAIYQLLCICDSLLVIAANNDIVWIIGRRRIVQQALQAEMKTSVLSQVYQDKER